MWGVHGFARLFRSAEPTLSPPFPFALFGERLFARFQLGVRASAGAASLIGIGLLVVLFSASPDAVSLAQTSAEA